MKQAPRTVQEAAEVVKDLEELRMDAKLGKDKHFVAAERKQRYGAWVGLPPILINVLLGSVFFSTVLPKEFGEVVGPLLAFVAAALSAIHVFFNFNKMTAGHRGIGNRYIAISRQCRTLVRGFRNGLIAKKRIWEQLLELQQEYMAINTDGEAFPTSTGDYQMARKLSKAGDLGDLDEAEMGGPPTGPKSPSSKKATGNDSVPSGGDAEP